MNHDGVRSRKFWMAWFILINATAAMYWADMDGAVWVAACTLCLGVYGAANVAEKRS
jgi:hypothetical protein